MPLYEGKGKKKIGPESRYTRQERAYLEECIKNRILLRKVAEELGRSYASVCQHVHKYGGVRLYSASSPSLAKMLRRQKNSIPCNHFIAGTDEKPNDETLDDLKERVKALEQNLDIVFNAIMEMKANAKN